MTDPTERFVGIINQGCTCYLNTVIQALFHLPSFRKEIFNLEVDEKNPVALALKNIFAQLAAQSANITTVELTNAFGWDASEATVQHDVHEMTQQLFDSLENTLKGTPKENFIRDMFSGKMVYRSTVVEGVDYVSDRLEEFYDVELVVKDKSTINESLAAFVAAEKIDGVTLEITPGAKPTKHNIERSQRFLDVPPVLLIHPNRVAFDTETFDLVTLSNRWSFDLDLDLNDFMIDESTLKLDKESLEKMTKLKAKSTRTPLGAKYRLRSILTHAGSATMGHYYAYVRFGEEWVRFDDDVVETASAAEVLKSAFGGQSVQARYRLFENERASLLVFVNEESEETVLAEEEPPESILEIAHKIEAVRKSSMNSCKVTYLVCNEHLVDVLDSVPNALAAQSREIKIDSNTPGQEAMKVFGEALGVDPRCIRLLEYNWQSVSNSLYHRLSAPYFAYMNRLYIVQILDSPKADHFVCFVRHIEDNVLSKAKVITSRSELFSAVPSGWCIVSCSGMRTNDPNVVAVKSWEDIVDGANLIICPTAADRERVRQLYEKRQLTTTDVFFVNKMHMAVPKKTFSLTLPDYTLYSALQGGVFDTLTKSKFADMPKSKEYIAFYRREGGAVSFPSSQPVWPCMKFPEGKTQETPLSLMLYSSYWNGYSGGNNVLYFTFLPIPINEVDCSTILVMNLGWAKQPRIFLRRSESQTNLNNLVRNAIMQVGSDMPDAILKRYEKNKQACDQVFRLFLVENGKIRERVETCTEEVSLRCDTELTWVLDLHSPSLPGYESVDVYFCNRRSGEFYFGFPTTVSLSEDMRETGSEVLTRVVKRFLMPEEKEKEARKSGFCLSRI
ncbi:cysteine peptidase, Clan CA, family C19 [Strigomonas culicis]|uniref:ubiquitinyl hydrolase 1 n=1 Tax=Strigomonas culicis TaxID=28005 RepID=S9VRI8_9TRYP|nr:cysteine peptidase, Clan CA, family C19 [Strigomonas culicis]|eukprot:EPY25815.1 cysteine peptidase, Clan CA, family C19 [Strigomonas culicis]